MRPEVVKFCHRQFSLINEKFYHISLPKTIQLFFCFLNAAVMTITVKVHNQFILSEAHIQMFEMKITV